MNFGYSESEEEEKLNFWLSSGTYVNDVFCAITRLFLCLLLLKPISKTGRFPGPRSDPF